MDTCYNCTGIKKAVKMDKLKKAMQLLNGLEQETKILEASERVELKRGRSGHYRVFIACLENTPEPALAGVSEVGQSAGYTANPYRKAGHVTSVSFADDDEPQRSR